TRSRRSWAARTSTASPARGTRCWPASAPRRRREPHTDETVLRTWFGACDGHVGERPRTVRCEDRSVRHVLVVANETIAGEALLERIRSRAGEDDVRFTVIAPISDPREGYAVYEDTRRA